MRAKVVSTLLGFLMLAGGGLAVVAGPTIVEESLGITASADAATNRTNYVAAPKWWGWCPGGWPLNNRVKNIRVTNHTHGGQWFSWGDRVTIGTRHGWQQLTVAVECTRSTPIGVNVWVRSDRSGQTHYVGFPAGSWSN